MAVFLLRPFRCNVCMRRFWWWAWNPRKLARHQQLLLAAAVVIMAVLGSYLYLRTLPYEAELPRPAGVRAVPPPGGLSQATNGAGRLGTTSGEGAEAPRQAFKRPSTAVTSESPPAAEPPSTAEGFEGVGAEEGPSLPAPPPFEASALRDSGRLLDVLSVADDDGLHLLLKTDAPPRTFQHFRLQAPARLVVDIQGGWRTDLPTALVLDHALTRGLRIGQHEDMVRVVVELVDDRIVPPEVEVRADGLTFVLRRP